MWQVTLRSSETGFLSRALDSLIRFKDVAKTSYYVMVVFCQTKPASGQLVKNSSNSSTVDTMNIVMIILSCWRRDSFSLWTMTPPARGPTDCANPKHRPSTSINQAINRNSSVAEVVMTTARSTVNKKAQLTQSERATAVHVWRPTANRCKIRKNLYFSAQDHSRSLLSVSIETRVWLPISS